MDRTDELDKNEIHCVYGLFTGSRIITDVGYYMAITYKIIWDKARNKLGFYNLKWEDEIQTWGIIQYILNE